MNDTKHADYEGFAKKWLRTRAACQGQSAVHALGEEFLPKLAEQSVADYNNYKMRATYFNASGRTLEGLQGMIFSKAPACTVPTGLEAITKDIDLSGNSIEILAMRAVNEVIEVGRIGMLVEYPASSPDVRTAADADRLNIRPYVSTYPAESIIDWRIERVNNAMQPVMIKLAESYEEKVDNFTYKCGPQIRALLLVDGVYIQQLYRKAEGKDEWVQFGEDIIPKKSGKPLTAIPFWAFGPKTNSLDLQDPPILDLVDLNLAHYRVNADYERGCHFAGLPTPVLAGFTFGENEKVCIGSSTILATNDAQAKWGFLEFTGQGLTALLDNLKQKEAQMAAIGARMLAPEKLGVEAADTLMIRSNGENSVLASLANLVSENLEQILAFMGEWAGVAGEVSYKLNTDFIPVKMTAQELDSVVKAWQSGALPKSELFAFLKKGEIISEKISYEDYEEELANDGAPAEGE
jgi:hypothetical protein